MGEIAETGEAEAKAPPGAGNLALLVRLWRDWLAPYWRSLALNLGLIALVAGSTAAYPLIIKWALEGFETKDLTVITVAPFIVVGAVGAKSVALYLQRLLTNKVLAWVDADLQRAMYRALVRADLATLAREAPAALASRFTADIQLVRNTSDKIINSLVRDGLTVVGLLGSLLWIDWRLTLYALAALPLAALPIAAIGQRLRRIAKRSQEEAATMTARVAEGLSGIRLAKTYRLEDYVAERAGASFDQIRDLKIKAADQKALIDPLLELLAGAGLAVVFYIIGVRIAEGTNTIGEFMAFVSAFLIAGQPLRAFGDLYAVTLQGSAALERIFGVLDEAPTIADRPGAKPLPRVRGELRLENVSFAYADGIEALSSVDLTAPAGARVALVGRSGAGKSTIFNLIPRLYDATAGRVTIDGVDVRDVTLESLRDQIAVVSQDAVIFDDTVANNIGFGRPGASRDEIVAAAKAASAHDFISRLPEGYDTRSGEGGGRFSGGERQRLTIARAILRDAPILLLDEATSALDAESEHAIRAALERLSEGRTTFVIAHRLSTVQDADSIVVLDQGRIVEQGPHAELIAKGGLYADLHRLQFRESES
jgi:subfamily B ATP-binding cassette protein MsbA